MNPLLRVIDRFLPKPEVTSRPMEDAKACLATVLNDAFVPYFLVLIYSIKKHNPWFNFPIIIIHSTHLSPLSEENKKAIRQSHHSITFHLVSDEHKYDHFFSDTPDRLRPALLTLEAFAIRGFDTVVFLDSDMLCIGDISALFTTNVSFGVCRAGKNMELKERVAGTHQRGMGFNSGLMVIGKKYLNDATYQTLFRYKSGPCADQDVLNHAFHFRSIYFFPHIYNYNVQFFWTKNSKDVRILHYTGPKPLEHPEMDNMKVWFEYHRELQN